MITRKPCQITEVRKTYRTLVLCQCGWSTTVFNRNARARASKATAEGNNHLKRMKEKQT